MFANTASASTYLGGGGHAACMQRPVGELWSDNSDSTRQHNAYSWKCRSNYTHYILGGVSVNQECVLQYGWGAYAGLGSASNPYSWYGQR
jgi:hypothetical protein